MLTLKPRPWLECKEETIEPLLSQTGKLVKLRGVKLTRDIRHHRKGVPKRTAPIVNPLHTGFKSVQDEA
ncbi:predicted protein [Lichtheimia corymbifera JMRC:FSU:9682]|uniref:Uncharacterized protein n=1 Tax=Lichtheimia corymbifera JMRC:FSU:9682 TaxID=1263082 RepID=A0A068RP52_9FUNG|nr:predicted protein [Lichtheimia corymbifera JMRC:FSU:9682]